MNLWTISLILQYEIPKKLVTYLPEAWSKLSNIGVNPITLFGKNYTKIDVIHGKNQSVGPIFDVTYITISLQD